MSDAPRIFNREHLGISAEQVRDARARAWAYCFDCFNRRNGQEGGPVTAPDDAKKESKHVGAKTRVP